MTSTSSSREKILARIREALSAQAPPPHGRDEPGALNAAEAHTEAFRDWLPPVGESYADRVNLFAESSEKLKTEFERCADAAEAAAKLKALASESGWKRLALHKTELTEKLAAETSCDLFHIDNGANAADDRPDVTVYESCDAGLSECETLIAQTGSLCVTAPSSGGRALSALPPHHIVVAQADQLVGDLAEAIERLKAKYEDNWPSFISFITGPSRTGDIERILVLGAHGPKRLTVLLIEGK